MCGHSYKDYGFVLYSAVFANILLARGWGSPGQQLLVLLAALVVLSEPLKMQSFGHFKAEISLCCPHTNRDSHKELLKYSGEYKIIKSLRLEKSCRIAESKP